MQQDPSQNPQSAEAQNWHPPMAEVQAVDPTQTAEAQVQTLEQQLGLPDQFIVRRGDETDADIADTGWKVDGFKDIIDPRDTTGNTVIRAVKISKLVTEPNGDTIELSKARPLETLLSWQQASPETEKSVEAEQGLEAIGAPAVHAEVAVDTTDTASEVATEEVSVEQQASVETETHVQEQTLEVEPPTEAVAEVSVSTAEEDPAQAAEFRKNVGRSLSALSGELDRFSKMPDNAVNSAISDIVQHAQKLEDGSIKRTFEGAAVGALRDPNSAHDYYARHIRPGLQEMIGEDKSALRRIDDVVSAHVETMRNGRNQDPNRSRNIKNELVSSMIEQSRAVTKMISPDNPKAAREAELFLQGMAVGLSDNMSRSSIMRMIQKTLVKE